MCIFSTLGEFLSRMSDKRILGIRVKLTYFFPSVGSMTPISNTLLAVSAMSSRLQSKWTSKGLAHRTPTGKCDLRA